MAVASDQVAIDAIAAKFRSGDIAGARADCEQFLATVSDAVRQSPVRFWLGTIEARSGSQAAAVKQFELGLAINRRDPFWLLQAGLTHFHLGEHARAEQLYRDALRLEPRHAIVHYNLGVLLQQRADFKGARRAFEAATTHQPRFAEAHTNLANTLVALGDVDAAEPHYRQALAINPKLAHAHYGLGLHHLRKQELPAAIHDFKAAVEHNPGHIDAWLDLAECQHRLGQDDQALASVNQILARDPGHATAQFKRAQFSGQQPDAAPRGMIERLYTGMAETFDEHLTQRLGYRIPSQLIEAINPWLNDFARQHGRRPDVLDLGCGTGLFGVAVRQFTATLTGVDLSVAMLEKARQRAIYDELVESDLDSFLSREAPGEATAYDLITATDVLIYIGNLDSLFPQIAAQLSPDGLFAFSTETPKQFTEDFRLEASGRYVHSVDYITRLAETSDLDLYKRIDTVVRTENAVPLDGHIFILKKRPI